MWLLRPPGVYRPQADTWLLAQTLRDAGIPFGARVLDMCTGTGALAIAAAGVGAGHITAVDISRRAALTTRFNTRVRRIPVRVERRDALTLPARRQFDVILANPPYVPSPRQELPRSGPARAWDAARDGRALLDPLCANAPGMLADGGMLLIVHSDVCGVETTVELLRGGGLKAAVVARRTVPFGPVMRRRIALLEDRGVIRAGQREEELVVIRGDRRDPPP
ncbi:HemK2/MTQ2 family protein methyltransferase [Streptomyces sp. BE147]|uniref:HemK2/MTQ2 family protein methyltransferase n=1 Tax=unclassified Streptomyces TaxID=2593676 RepID=UPI002E79EF48|nr:HemK2/MTQ2 family protein methyltransferase [Streptomyces sp. BE147]MEE1738688.1 methyltransferase [Streptomyces sp. BE147]